MNKRYMKAPLLFVLACTLGACSKNDGSRDDMKGSSNGAAAQTRASNPGPGGNGAPGGQGSSMRPPSVLTLAATDITPVRRGPVEEAVAITGNLQPLERVEVRARIEGELEEVLVREGELVRAGQVLARFESNEQESAAKSAEADRTAATTEVNTAEWNLEQTRELFKEGAVPERDVKAGEQAVASARARLAAAEQRVRTASEALRDTRVVAPATALVERRNAAPGEHVTRGTSLFTVVRTETLELTGAVPARDANRVKTGQVVRFNADARTFVGRVARVSPTIDSGSRSMGVYIQIPNPGGTLKGGTFAAGRIVSRVSQNALIVPTTAVRQELNTGTPYVYRIEGDQVERRNIHLGIIDEGIGIAEVTEGLEEGDRIVTGTVGTISRTTKVQIIGGEGRRGGAAGSPPPVPRN